MGGSVQRRRDLQGRRIGVLAGGFNEERNLSLDGGRDASESLRKSGYDATLIDWSGPDMDLVAALRGSNIDVCFTCLHGSFGEDGHIAGLLEVLRIPYTFSGVFGSACGSDKARAKELLAAKPDVTLVPGVQSRTDELRAALRRGEACPVELPVMVKDPLQGSSKGVWLCKCLEEYSAAVGQVSGTETVVEKFIPGVDIVVCMIEDGLGGVHAWPVMEFETELEWQDNASKNALWGWEGGGSDEQERRPAVLKHCPPKHLDPAIRDKAIAMARAVFRHLRAKTALNVEFRVCRDTGNIHFIEVSVVPGLTATSVHAACAQAGGVPYDALVEKMLATARLDLGAPQSLHAPASAL